jgi:YegS/Rv2252/BmrU family lipid kinase
MTPLPGPKALFIFNPAAGKGRAVRHVAAIREAVAAAGFDPDFRHTQEPGHGVFLAEAAARDGASVVVAVGGDGTVNEVVGGLMRVDPALRPALGLIPIGTGNDYAKVLGLKPGDFRGAAAAITAPRTRFLDAGEVNGRFFANGVGLGFDGAVAERAGRMRLVEGFPAYLASVFAVLASWRNFELTVEADGEKSNGRALLATVGIGPCCGGGFYLTPDARPDDGLFDLCRLGDFGKLEAVANLPKALSGKHVGHVKTSIRRARRILLRSDRPLTAHVDGNLMLSVGYPEPLEFRIHPGALRVIGRWE